jgi:hypothetical protein
MSNETQDAKAPLLDGDILSKNAPDLLDTCEEVHAWMEKNEDALMERWPADVTYLIDILAENIDAARGTCPGAEQFFTYDDMGFTLPHVRETMAVSKSDGGPAAILEDLKATGQMIVEIMSHMRKGEWTHASLSNVMVIVRDVMKEVAKAVAARNELDQQTAWLRSCLDRDGHCVDDITMQQIYAYIGEFKTAFPEEGTPRYSLRMARRQLEKETTVCRWSWCSSGYWETACRGNMCFTGKKGDVKSCHSCGRPVEWETAVSQGE